MDILRYARSLRRHWRLLLLTTVLGLGLGAGSAMLQTERTASSWYRAEHTLLCSKATANYSQLATFVTTGPVPENAAARLEGSPAALADQVRARPIPEANLLQITAVDSDAVRSEQIADTFAEELMAYELQLPDAEAEQKVAELRVEQDAAQERYSAALAAGASAATLDEAERLKLQHDEAFAEYERLGEEIKTLEQGGSRTACLSTVSTAEAVPTSRDAVNELLSSPQIGKAKSNATATGAGLPDLDKGGNSLGPVPRGAAGAAAGLLAGIALGLLIDRLDPRIRTKDQAETAFGWPVIAEIPTLSRSDRKGVLITTHEQPRSRVAEAYRVLRSAVLFAADVPDSFGDTARAPGNEPEQRSNGNGTSTSTDDRRGETDETSTSDTTEQPSTRPGRAMSTAGRRKSPTPTPDGESAPAHDPGRPVDRGDTRGTGEVEPARDRDAIVVMVSSPGPSEGKTTSVANLAAAFAEADAKVLVVNCDFRRPRVHNYLGGDAEEIARHPAATNYAHIDLFDHHSADIEDNPAEIVAEQRRMVRRARTRYDVIILDTAPLLSTNDATELLTEADLIVIIGRAGKTTKEAADRAAELLDRRGAPVLGVVLVGVTEGPSGSYYYYGSNKYYSDETRRDLEASQSPLEAMADQSSTTK